MTDLNTFDTHEIVKRLIGPIKPIGETNQDAKRFENLGQFCELFNQMWQDLYEVARLKESPEASVARAAKFADKFMDRYNHD